MADGYNLPFMQQAQPQSGMGMGSNGVFNMGMWGQQTPANASMATGNSIPYAPKYGGFGGSGQTGMENMWDKIGGMQGLNQGISAFSNLAGIYAGFKSLGLAKDQFKFAKSSFNKNFNASAQAYNNQLEERWEQKKNIYESRGREYEGMESWMADKTIDKTGKRDKDNKGKG